MCSCRRISCFFVVSGAVVAVLIGFLHQPPDPFKISPTGYWGPSSVKNVRAAPEDDPTINKFSVHAPDEALADLRRRLASTRFAEPLRDSGFQYGFSGRELRRVVDHWKDRFDWRQQERRLNAFEHYHTAIEGIRVHFMYARAKPDPKTKVYTLLMTHGWPGSVVEFLKIAAQLRQPKKGVAFEVICPSIPGYGFSEAPHRKGFNGLETARVFVKLMDRLGRPKFYVQGGDWGAMVSKLIATYYPERVLGVHMNMMDVELGPLEGLKMLLGSYFPSLLLGEGDKALSNYMFPSWSRFLFLLQESGYMHLQATKPDTIGLALLNSPAGLAAYILEKFSTWTRNSNVEREDGGLEEKYSLDELLTNVMLYWLTDSIGSSMRYYKENFGVIVMGKPRRTPVTVPTGFSIFPEELAALPRSVIGNAYPNVVTFVTHPRGGHFSAFEEPELLEKDIRDFVAAVEARNASKPGPFPEFPFVDVGPQLLRATVTFGPSSPAGGGQRFEPTPVEPQQAKPEVAKPAVPPPARKQPEVKVETKPVEKKAPPPPPPPSRKEEPKPAAKPVEQKQQPPPPPPVKQESKPEARSAQPKTQEKPKQVPPPPTAKSTPPPAQQGNKAGSGAPKAASPSQGAQKAQKP